MNWNRGFFRLWLIGTVVWICLAAASILPSAATTYWDFRSVPSHMGADARTTYEKSLTASNDMGGLTRVTDPTVATIELGRRLTKADNALNSFLWVGLLPPVVMLGVGTALAWALQGFAKYRMP